VRIARRSGVNPQVKVAGMIGGVLTAVAVECNDASDVSVALH
jgi:hypothetical protein